MPVVLFGTDGVRGTISERTVSNPMYEYIENRIFSKELCGEIGYWASYVSGKGEVVIGWDRRPTNQKIAEYLAISLGGRCSEVSLLGETTTPALQYEMTLRQAALGIMITASHNPSTDTGMKLLFRNGRKPTKGEEAGIESNMFQVERGERLIPDITPSSCANYIESVSEKIQSLLQEGAFPKYDLMIDGSGGWISSWLADLMSSQGVKCRELGSRTDPINLNCGAGGLSEGRISWKECKESQHILLKEIQPVPKGQIIGFCFDGDGDRCYMICSLGDSANIVGGDGFLSLFLQSRNKKEGFVVSVTVESSLDLSKRILAVPNGKIIETGVGDRWLQHALMREDEGILRLGAEPSGHVVLEHSIQDDTGLWGDGILTMFEFLRMIRFCGPEWVDLFYSERGIIMSGSIFPSNRSLWNPAGETGDLARKAISSRFNIDGTQIHELKIEGEDDLLMMRFDDGEDWSVAVRNSGTEEKTRLTIRTTSNDRDKVKLALDDIIHVLRPVLSP